MLSKINKIMKKKLKYIQTETNMRENGRMVNSMEKVYTIG